MDIKQFQKEVLEVFSQTDEMPNRRKHTKQTALIHLMEEIGKLLVKLQMNFIDQRS